MPATQVIVFIIALALLFDFLNGMNDAANSIATIVSTRVLSPRMAVAWIFRRWSPGRVDRLFRIGQLFSSGLFSLGHGANDAQKTMGIIVMVLVAAGWQEDFHVPVWVIQSCH